METERGRPRALSWQTGSYWRHLKRYMHSPEHHFVAIAPSELASLCSDELRALGIEKTTLSEAGVEFSGRLEACYTANLWLSTASRVLCRLPSTRTGAVEELFGKVSAWGWEWWLSAEAPLHVEAHVEHSRISHEGLVAQTVLSGIQKRFKEAGAPVPLPWAGSGEETASVRHDSSASEWRQRVLVRLMDNQCAISLDTTGAHLHQRGYRPVHAGAPLRETLAAAVLRKVGWRGESPLVDGMCGAGTVPIEGARLARKLPPGMDRTFLFQKWPSFKGRTWHHLLQKARDGALPEAPAPIVAVEMSPEAMEIAQANAMRAGVEKDIRWRPMDFFQFRPAEEGLAPGVVVLDPPYGKRLEGGGRDWFEQLGRHLREAFAGWRLAVLMPEKSLAMSMRIPGMRFWNIRHGGMEIVVGLATV